MTEQQANIESVASGLGLSMQSRFIPFSRSRNAGEKQPSLNWEVTILKNGRPVITTDYTAGCGHCPSYQFSFRQTIHQQEVVRRECEMGISSVNRKPIAPSLADVLYSLISDAEAIDHADFDSWADDFGMDPGSRKAEATYRECVTIGLKLRNAIGEEGIARLREALQDY